MTHPATVAMKMLRYLLPLLLVSVTATSAFSLSSLFHSEDKAEEVADEIEKLIEERGLSLFSAITIENDNSGQLSKGLVVYQPPKRVTALTEKYDDILALVESTVDMQLSGKTVVNFEKHGSQATYFSVGNNRYSRKAYEAVIKAKF